MMCQPFNPGCFIPVPPAEPAQPIFHGNTCSPCCFHGVRRHINPPVPVLVEGILKQTYYSMTLSSESIVSLSLYTLTRVTFLSVQCVLGCIQTVRHIDDSD